MLRLFQLFSHNKSKPLCTNVIPHIAGAILACGGLFLYDQTRRPLDDDPRRSSSHHTLLDRNDVNDSLKSVSESKAVAVISPPPKGSKVHTALEEFSSLHSPIGPWRILRPNPDLEICFDTRTRNAVYVQHRLLVSESQNSVKHDAIDALSTVEKDDENPSAPSTWFKRPRYHFYEESSIEEPYRSRNNYYHLSGYDRGHLAPAADFTAQDPTMQHNGKNAIADTYNLCNISPQHAELNRKQWSYLEQWTRRIARQYWHQENEAVTYVTTGPLWLPRHQIREKTFRYDTVGIGQPPSIILVPTHFFKVVVVLNHDETRIKHFACFVLPNDPSILETTNRSLQEYLVSWSDLEAVTGLSFYPDLVDDNFKEQADIVTETIMADATVPDRSIQGSGQPKLLTSGGETNGMLLTSKNGKSRLLQPSDLRHLCANQACAPRK